MSSVSNSPTGKLKGLCCRTVATTVRAFVCAVLGWTVIVGSGCARRAYTEVYVENMASEIRDLEDQLYEFDNEYRVLEQELQTLQAENSRLRVTLPGGAGSGPANRSFRGNDVPSPDVASPRPLPLPNNRSSSDMPSNLPDASSSSRKANPAPGSAGNTFPQNDAFGRGTAPSNLPSLAPNLEGASSPLQPLPGAGDLPSPRSPSIPPSSSNLTPPADLPMPKPVPRGGKPAPLDDLQDLVPPTIEQGEVMPPILPAPQTDPSTPLTLSAPGELEVELGQMPMPTKVTAADARTAPETMLASGPARLPQVAELPRDMRIVEVRFHPSLCRAVNLSGEGEDEALSLVLQPFNTEGQFVPTASDLLIIAVDPSRDNSQRPTGRWTLTADEARAKLQPIGSSQGMHLTLPWTGPKPQADRLVVFVYATLPDGRRLVSEQEIFLNNNHRQHTVWVPRAENGRSPVRTASGQRPAQ